MDSIRELKGGRGGRSINMSLLRGAQSPNKSDAVAEKTINLFYEEHCKYFIDSGMCHELAESIMIFCASFDSFELRGADEQ